MNYKAKIVDSALEKFREIPQELREKIAEKLIELEKSPTTISRMPAIPFLDRQRVEFFAEDANGERVFIYFFFLFGDDEETLFITDLCVRPL